MPSCHPHRLLLSLLLLLIGGAAALAQAPPDRFVRRYEAGLHGRSRMSNIWPTDSGYLAIMFTADTTSSETYWAMETLVLDSAFEVTARHRFGDTTKWYIDWLVIHNTIPDGLGNFWYWAYCYSPQDTAYGTYYGKFGQNGDTIFEHKLPLTGPNDYPWEMVAIPGGGGLLTQYSYVQFWERTRLFFFDAYGNITSRDSINPISANFIHGAPNTSVDITRGEIYIPTNDFRYTSYAYDIRPRIFVYDFQGHRLRSMSYANTLRDHFLGYVHRTEDNGYVGMLLECIADSSIWENDYRSAIVKMDSSMNFEWKRSFWDKRLYNGPQTFDKAADGNFYMGGIRDTSTDISTWHTVGYLMKFSPTLDSLWLRMFAEPDSVESTVRIAAQSQVLQDRSILYLMDNIPGVGKYSLLYHLDSCGYLIERCEVDTGLPPPPHDTLWPKPQGHVIAYPNPSNGLWTLVWDVNVDDRSVLSIYDVAGRELLQTALVREERPSLLDLRDWSQGVYLLQIRSENGRVFRTKLLLSR